MNKWILFITAVFVMQFTYLPFSHADEEGVIKEGFAKKWHEKMDQKVQEIYAQLDLTDEQKTQLEANKQKSMEDMKASFEGKKSLKAELNQELMKPQLDMAKIEDIQTRIKASQAEMADRRLNSILEVRKILTPEQFTKFISLMEEKKKERFGKMDSAE